MNRRKVCCDCGDRILLFSEARELWVVQISSCLAEQDCLRQQSFPPQGVEVVSWYVMMGIGQVVTLRVPAERLREVNRTIENTAWGGYRTEFYPTYDFKAIAEQMRVQAAGK